MQTNKKKATTHVKDEQEEGNHACEDEQEEQEEEQEASYPNPSTSSPSLSLTQIPSS